MNNAQFKRELMFRLSMAIVEQCAKQALIPDEDTAKWWDSLIRIYTPPIGQIVSDKVGKPLDFTGVQSE